MWLYDMAEYRDAPKPPTPKPKVVDPKPKSGGKGGKKVVESDDEIDYEEESSFGPKSYKDI